MNDKELLSEILVVLQLNMSLGHMTTEDDEQFLIWIEKWLQGKSARYADGTWLKPVRKKKK